VIGMRKMDRKYVVCGRELKSEAIIKLKGLRKGAIHYSRKYKSQYIHVDSLKNKGGSTHKKAEPVNFADSRMYFQNTSFGNR
jgi:hypothetical protein